MERSYGSNQTADVDGHKLIVCFDVHGTGKLGVLDLLFGAIGTGGSAWFGCSEVWQEVEYILEMTEDGVVDGEVSVQYLLKILANIPKPKMKAL